MLMSAKRGRPRLFLKYVVWTFETSSLDLITIPELLLTDQSKHYSFS
jgi:hypothetical protein